MVVCSVGGNKRCVFTAATVVVQRRSLTVVPVGDHLDAGLRARVNT